MAATNPRGRAARNVHVADQVLALLCDTEDALTTNQIASQLRTPYSIVLTALHWLENREDQEAKRLDLRPLRWEAMVAPLPVDRMWLTNVKPPVLETPHE